MLAFLYSGLFLLFFLSIFLSIYAPGFLILRVFNKELKDDEVITLALNVGVIVFVLIAVILALLHIRFLSPFVFLLASGFCVYRHKIDLILPWRVFKDTKLTLLIILGILTLGFINFPSGFLYNNGLLFWSSQGHDGLWHVASMEQIKRSIPPNNPGFAGEVLYNYHYLVDILMGEFGRMFPFFSSLDLYFRFFPVLFAFLIGMSVYSFMKRWQESKNIAYLGIFFTYFVGSFGFVVNFLRTGSVFGGETIFWAAQQNTIIGNPPHAVSHAIFPAFLLMFLIFTKNATWKNLLLTFLLGSILAGFKVSGGLVLLVGVTSASLMEFLFNKNLKMIVLPALLSVSNFLTFKIMTSPEAASFLMFLPWWFIRTMIVAKLGWIDLENKRQHYLSKGTWHAYLRVFQIEALSFLIFVIGNLGMRVLGFVDLVKNAVKYRKFIEEPINVMLFFSMLTGFFIPIFFVQKGLIYNNIQFMQYFLLIMGFFGAVATHNILKIFKSSFFKILVVLFIFTLSLPTVIGNLVEFYGPGKQPLAVVDKKQLEALSFLKDHTVENAIVLNYPFNQYLKDKFKIEPRPIYAWYDTPYISALSSRVSFLASEHVTLLGYPTEQRLKEIKKFFEEKDYDWNINFLKHNKIGYIYVNNNELEKSFDLIKNHLEVFFENSEVVIYHVT